ncbi:MAG: type II secretion system F family protein [Aestuariivirgaceae bacterium]
MELSEEVIQLAFVVFIALSVGGAALALFYPYFTGEANATRRVSAVADKSKAKSNLGLKARLKQDAGRRRQIHDSLKELEEREKRRKKKMTLRTQLLQAGLDVSVRSFWITSLIVGVILAAATFVSGAPPFVAPVAGLVGALGLPRWTLSMLRKRRQEIFLHEFADAIDVMVRGLKAGLPVNDAMKVIASESGPPVGPEFSEVVEGQRVGITIGQGIERMYDRMPLAEVNFLAIVMAIQAKTGGNLAEALANLSVVLRDRKKMKAKIKAVSQEAKASASIIGSLPFVICGGMSVLNPEHLNPLWQTNIGNLIVVFAFVWMGTGVLVMRKMINFEI